MEFRRVLFRSVQGEIEETLRRITRQPVSLIGAGRTDAGVHARGQGANFQRETGLPCAELEHALNALLPEDIVIRRVSEAPLDFHARYSARERSYSYTILRVPSAMQR